MWRAGSLGDPKGPSGLWFWNILSLQGPYRDSGKDQAARLGCRTENGEQEAGTQRVQFWQGREGLAEVDCVTEKKKPTNGMVPLPHSDSSIPGKQEA